MADRAEIIDHGEAFNSEFFGDQSWTDDPGIVGKLDHLAPNWSGYGDGTGPRQRLKLQGGKGFPGGLE